MVGRADVTAAASSKAENPANRLFNAFKIYFLPDHGPLQVFLEIKSPSKIDISGSRIIDHESSAFIQA